MLADLLYCVALKQLRIPRLNYAKSIVVLQIVILWVLDGLLFGGVKLHLFGGPGMGGAIQEPEYYTTPSALSFAGLISTLSLGLISGDVIGDSDSHLLGQHTVRMSPISAAQLNPYHQTFCLASPSSHILIPVLLNNSNPTMLKYSVTPLGYTEGSRDKVDHVTLSAKDLKAIENARQEALPLTKSAPSKQDLDYDEYDEYDEEDRDELKDAYSSASRLQRSQSMVWIRLSKPGTVHLDAVGDTSGVEARLFVDDDVITRGDNVRCAVPGSGMVGDERDMQLGLSIYGVPPLSLRWYKEVNGRREYFMVEGIEGGVDRSGTPAPAYNAPQDIHVPLTITSDALGTHAYVLESVTDALGNIEIVGSPGPLQLTTVTRDANGTLSAPANTKNTRILHVLRRPTVSFKSCRPDRPASLRIGSETTLTVSVNEGDILDAPWDISMKYQPVLSDDDTTHSSKRFKPWKKTLHTEKDKKELSLKTNVPGEFTITGVKGKYCEGDVLSPDVCTVVELPKPTAEIEWKRIHECSTASGDIGVSASVVLHGTPPFHVFYRMQRDNEPPRELVQSFHSSRGEVTLQPPQSGHYIYSFSHLSDANYKKVELSGPSIDQIVHPLASASFVDAGPPGREKRIINSCSGDTVDVDVQLGGTGPWNLEVQVVGPKGSDTIMFPGIQTARKRLQLPIPKSINQSGGTFEIDLVSIEDSYGCKRSLSVPGVSVNVKRTKPSVRFYSHNGKRRITVLENEEASLPLRLTGDAPWRIKYRRVEQPDQVLVQTLHTPNDNIRVKEKGTYEIIDVTDAQCPGTVVVNESTYEVDWVPRPSAQISPNIEGTLVPYNGSFILPPICEGQSSHVDLDLTGRPPFQIMYNIAQASEFGGTKLLDQPTFNSIQPRTRFQLHTSEPGHIYYEVKQVGDAAYPLSAHKGAVIPRSDRPLFEQRVLRRPSARFDTTNRLSHCLYDTLTPRDKWSSDGVVLLEGTPPFELTVAIRSLAESANYVETVTVLGNSWKLDLSSYKFEAVGQHRVTIESVRDASHCEEVITDPRARAIWVDVAESAAITPLERREHFCIGDTAQFQLQGIPPWTVGYEVNGKAYTQEVKTSPFAVGLQQQGEFKITSVAHQQAMCKSVVTDLHYPVHALPSARVGAGDQAEIKFTLIGEPPFTFTYQRHEPSPRKGGKPGKVLETHTVSGVNSKEYSIFSAREGTWTVSFISDRYCRYPPSHPDGVAEK
ncbi:hypothetical protein EWM64_g1741 [Hericium alpestre]|uniref:Ig-like domain-containing protein n=1 Tax=Hericium alpestre TaxID=135208 RepID=A0A4Z0A8M0_9AGAM|nr:hypothetical protein EWM64_g1741 [Hericium alpestre]